MNASRLKSPALALVVALAAVRASAITIDWVTVGDPGNAADTTTYGAVGYTYQIMKYEYDGWENFKAMFSGIGEDLKITVALLALTALPIYLALWIIIKLMEAA